MPLPTGPRAWAARMTMLLNATLTDTDRFPVDVAGLAREYSAQAFPGDPIRQVQGDHLPGFEGALVKIPAPKGGWGILYNDGIRSPGRIRFTLAHELGHYLVHRNMLPNGIHCHEDDVLRGSDSDRDMEREADQFAADLLMPYDDFRKQIMARSTPDLDRLSGRAERYGVSLIAAILRWLSYTEKRAILVVSREGFILWARSSEPAFRTGAFFRAARETIEIPAASLAAAQNLAIDHRLGVHHAPGVWLPERTKELTVFSQQYDMVLSLLLLGDAEPQWVPRDEDDEPIALPVEKLWR